MKILYGTETGNAELVAEDIVEALDAAGIQSQAFDMADWQVEELNRERFFVIVCSSYGDGELPDSAQPFYESLCKVAPDLSRCTFASFGLGDSFYETFNAGVNTIEEKLVELGATKVGVRGEHDASEGTIPTDEAIDWVETVLIPSITVKEAAEG